jgi:hypothetical protein
MQREYVYDILLLNSWNFYMAGKLGKVGLPSISTLWRVSV